MLHYIRSGERTPSMKLLRRIEEAERAAGLAPVAGAEERGQGAKGPRGQGAEAGEAEIQAIRAELERLTARLKKLERR